MILGMTRHLEHHHGIINFNYACNFLKEDVFLTLEPPGLISKPTRPLEHHQGFMSFSL